MPANIQVAPTRCLAPFWNPVSGPLQFKATIRELIGSVNTTAFIAG